MTPRLVKVACPQCGAGMRLDPSARLVTCSYCGLSSFVQVQDQPAPVPPDDGQRYGTIHVPKGASPKVIIVLAALILVLSMGMIAALAVGASRTGPTTRPSLAPVSAGGDNDDNRAVCARTVACCKTVLRATSAGKDAVRACEAMRALDDDACQKQLETFEKTAKTLGQTCP